VTFKEVSAKYLEPASIWTMVIGIVALCQPLNLTLHSYGVAIILLGLVGFNVFSRIKPPPRQDS
jgi:hypothetical protein